MLARYIVNLLLYSTVDGKGLRNFQFSARTHGWILDGKEHMPAYQYVSCIQVRGATLWNKLRASRGRPQPDVLCDGSCLEVETLSHLVQVCDKTKGPRIERHNVILRKISVKLQGLGWRTQIEPRISTNGGIRKPDLVAWNPDGKTLVNDVTIVSDMADLSAEFRKKVAKYDIPEIRDWVQAHHPFPECRPLTPKFTAYVSSWRGALALETQCDLKKLRFSKGLMDCFQMRVLWMSYGVWEFYRGSTWRASRHSSSAKASHKPP